jgi:hypothetical protein
LDQSRSSLWHRGKLPERGGVFRSFSWETLTRLSSVKTARRSRPMSSSLQGHWRRCR